MLTRLIVIISQCRRRSNHYVVHLRLIQCDVDHTSSKRKGQSAAEWMKVLRYTYRMEYLKVMEANYRQMQHVGEPHKDNASWKADLKGDIARGTV